MAKRYDHMGFEDEFGRWVRWVDHEALEQQLAEMRGALELAKPLLEKYDDTCRRLARDKSGWLSTSTHVANGFAVVRAIEAIDAALSAPTSASREGGATP